MFKAILAGICIGIASMMFLNVGGVVGAILFSFGLLAVVNYKWNLFTGMAGFTKDWKFLLLVLLFNIIGCGLVSLLVPTAINTIVVTRLALGWIKCLFLAMGCGFIMTTSVKFAREGNYLPLLFGVPVFILCGFPHCIADVVYYLSCPFSFLLNNASGVLSVYASTVIGNYIGCNLYRLGEGNTGTIT